MIDPLNEVPPINFGRYQRTNSEATKLMVYTKDKLYNTEKEVKTIDGFLIKRNGKEKKRKHSRKGC